MNQQQGNDTLSLFEWNPDYSVGSITIDQQHQRLLALCKEFTDIPNDESLTGKEVVRSVLNDIAFYAFKHFQSEEDVLRTIGYPKLNEQRIEHKDFNDRLAEFIVDFNKNKLNRIALRNYLEQWWIDHILNSDMQYSQYLKP